MGKNDMNICKIALAGFSGLIMTLAASAPASAVSVACATGGSFGNGSFTTKNDVVYEAALTSANATISGFCGNANNNSLSAVQAVLGGGAFFEDASKVFFSDTLASGEAETATFGIDFGSDAEIYPEIALVMKQSSSFAVFLIQLTDLSGLPVTGTWKIGKVKSNGSTELKSINEHSHVDLYYRGTPFSVVNPVPGPLALPLIASAFGVAFLVRSRRSA